MNILKKIVNVTLLQLIASFGMAQNDKLLKYEDFNNFSGYTVSIEIDKEEYSLAEYIYVRFKTNFVDDSIKYPDFKGFKIINGPNLSISTNMRGNEIKKTKSVFYVLKPYNSGEYVIESPIFFINGKEIKDWKKITVLNTFRTKKEESEVKFKIFAESAAKPNGTYRYVIGDEFGYIEIFENSCCWEFYRKLTNKEFKLIKTIK